MSGTAEWIEISGSENGAAGQPPGCRCVKGSVWLTVQLVTAAGREAQKAKAQQNKMYVQDSRWTPASVRVYRWQTPVQLQIQPKKHCYPMPSKILQDILPILQLSFQKVTWTHSVASVLVRCLAHPVILEAGLHICVDEHITGESVPNSEWSRCLAWNHLLIKVVLLYVFCPCMLCPLTIAVPLSCSTPSLLHYTLWTSWKQLSAVKWKLKSLPFQWLPWPYHLTSLCLGPFEEVEDKEMQGFPTSYSWTAMKSLQNFASRCWKTANPFG